MDIEVRPPKHFRMCSTVFSNKDKAELFRRAPWGEILLHWLEVRWKSFSCVQLFATPWAIQSMEFSSPECRSGLPIPSPGDLPYLGIKPRSPTLQTILFLIFISWRLITLQYCSGFCHTLTWISHGFTCIPHPDPPSHLPLHLTPLGLPSAPGPSTCLMHPTWAGDLFHSR